MELAQQLYPASIPLERTSEDNAANYLDARIRLYNHQITTSVYNKTDYFNFSVVRYGFADSNVHRRVGMQTFGTELLRFTRLSSENNSLELRIMDLYQNFLNNGFKRQEIIIEFFRFANKYKALLAKLGYFSDTDLKLLAQRIFCR